MRGFHRRSDASVVEDSCALGVDSALDTGVTLVSGVGSAELEACSFDVVSEVSSVVFSEVTTTDDSAVGSEVPVETCSVVTSAVEDSTVVDGFSVDSCSSYCPVREKESFAPEILT